MNLHSSGSRITLARAAYSALAWAVQPLLRRKLRRRAVAEPGYAEAVPERFGHYTPQTLGQDGRGQWVWVHAVSLGETRAAAILLQALRQKMPGMRLLLTHNTATGRAEGRKLLQEGDVQVWVPWDTLAATRAFIAQFRPAAGVLMETEIWPNLIANCTNAGIPMVL
ncbi:MAG: glycosyltransferase N-terminal domain-containing protein, partial [Comamonas sp.]